jgi:hypothetical protein
VAAVLVAAAIASSERVVEEFQRVAGDRNNREQR